MDVLYEMLKLMDLVRFWIYSIVYWRLESTEFNIFVSSSNFILVRWALAYGEQYFRSFAIIFFNSFLHFLFIAVGGIFPIGVCMDGGNCMEADAGDVTEHLHSPPSEIFDNDFRGSEVKKWPGWPGENVFRMLVPIQKVGSIIGRKGEYIRKINEETKARIRIIDGPPGTLVRVVSFCLILFLGY